MGTENRRQTIIDLIVYSVALRKLRKKRLAGYFAAIAFEVMTSARPRDSKGVPVYHIEADTVLFLDIRKHINRALREDDTTLGMLLNECRKHRNYIFHNFEVEVDRLNKLIAGLCHVVGQDAEEIGRRLDYEEYRRLEIQFAPPAEPAPAVPFEGMTPWDFDNLLQMRRSLGALADDLGPRLRNLDPRLDVDHLSEVNPTSAYVWLPFVRNPEGHRSKVERASLSVLATNRDVRVYLDFGGRATAARLAYCDVLESPEFAVWLSECPDVFEVFDIRWYFNLENRRTAKDFAQELASDGAGVREFLDQWRDVVRPGRTRTDNVMLVGRIYESEEAIRFGRAFTAEVGRVFETLYPVFVKVDR